MQKIWSCLPFIQDKYLVEISQNFVAFSDFMNFIFKNPRIKR